MKTICKLCRHHDKGNEKLIPLSSKSDPVLFRACTHPLIDGVNKKYHDVDTMILAMSKAKHPIYTHPKFGCRLFEQM